MDNRFEKENAANKIDGYYLPAGFSYTQKAAFIKGRAECIKHLKNALKLVEEMTFEEFMKLMRYKIR